MKHIMYIEDDVHNPFVKVEDSTISHWLLEAFSSYFVLIKYRQDSDYDMPILEEAKSRFTSSTRLKLFISIPQFIDLVEKTFPDSFIIRTNMRFIGYGQYAIPSVMTTHPVPSVISYLKKEGVPKIWT